MCIVNNSHLVIITLLFLCGSPQLTSAQPDLLWSDHYGTEYYEYCMYGCQTADGGYCLAGYQSIIAGRDDFYVVRTDAVGDTLWTCIIGGDGAEQGRQVEPTSDGGFAIFGYTDSFGDGINSCYFVKLDSLGNVEWTRTYGGTGINQAWGGLQTSDGGYLITGFTDNSETTSEQLYLIKTDADGDTIWTNSYGGLGGDYGYKILETPEGDFVVVGWTNSFGAGSGDVYLIKTDADGNLIWERTYGGGSYDKGRSVRQTDDGGYIIVGETGSFSVGSFDYYIIRTDANGQTLWWKTFGGLDDDRAKSVWITEDGGYIVSGGTFSFGPGPGEAYVWKMDPYGNTMWTLYLGGNLYDTGYYVQQTQDGGFMVAGTSESFSYGDRDFWLNKLDADLPLTTPDVTVDLSYVAGSPVPAGGGNLTFQIRVENQDSLEANFDGWMEISYEGGEPTTVGSRFFANFQPGWMINRPDMYFPVPSSYAAGNYTFTGKVGMHPDVAWAESSFPFEKEGSDHRSSFQPFKPDGAPDPFDEITRFYPQADNFNLATAYPNPFNPSTVLSFELRVASRVNLAVYDIAGREVAGLVDGWRDAGQHDVTFDGTGLASGIYIYRLQAGEFTAQGKMVLMK